jgi:hypothetical protein
VSLEERAPRLHVLGNRVHKDISFKKMQVFPLGRCWFFLDHVVEEETHISLRETPKSP